MDNLLTPDEVAARLKLEPKTIREWLRTGRLKGIKVGRFWRIEESVLEDYLKGNKWARINALSDEESKRLTQIAVEHVELAKMATEIPLGPDMERQFAEIQKKIEALRVERYKLIGE